MSKILLKSLFVSPALVGAAVLLSSSAMAAEVSTASKTAPAPAANELQLAQAVPANTSSLTQIRRYGSEGKGKEDSLGQVTSVSQLSDVQPTDWAFQALQSLVERYGCIAGYPNGTYRGNRALTRYEFAAGLNACMDRVNELIAAGTADLVRKEDLATLKKLQDEFAAELATLRGRVDALEARTATLEAQQFSTTTKLTGEVIFALTGAVNNPNAAGTTTAGLGIFEPGTNATSTSRTATNNQIVFQDRVRLLFNTSFTGKDLLVTRIAAGNAVGLTLPGGGPEATQTFNFGNTGGNNAFVDWLAYYLPVGDKAQLYIPAVSGLTYDFVPTVNPVLDSFDGGSTGLTIFSQRNPIYLIGGGSGIGLNYKFNPSVQLSLGYFAGPNTGNTAAFGANQPTPGNGLFNGSYTGIAQLTFTPGAFSLGLTYVNGYRTGGNAIFDGGSGAASVGTIAANTAARGAGLSTGNGAAINGYGVSAAYKVSNGFTINGFATYVATRDIGFGDGDIWSYGLGLAFPDLGKKGNLAGIVVGIQPYLAGYRTPTAPVGLRRDVPFHVEGFYKYQVSDNISITPGLIWITSPGQDNRNDSAVIGTIRTTFTF